MKTEALERYLNSFGKQVANRAKGSLQRRKGGGTRLEESIRYEVVKTQDGFSVRFYMNSYGTFVDKGVSGNKKIQEYKKIKNYEELLKIAKVKKLWYLNGKLYCEG